VFHVALGSQRRTYVCGAFAIKLPRLHRLLAGARANREEARVWREGWQRRYPELCPVVACLPFGIALIMPAAQIMSANEFDLFARSAAHPDHYPDPQLYEDKLGDWGYLRGQPVVVDYALRIHLMAEEIDARVRTLADAVRNAL